jgi:hyaluronan synthase
LAFLAVNTLALIWRIWLVGRYRPAGDVCDARLPHCTVAVPAFNEGEQVYHTLKSICRSDYPPQKMSVIAVDDGSTDDTWSWIKKAKEELPARLKTIRLPRNSGKRRALYAAFVKSRGSVLVTIDSDSIVASGTLRSLVSPFVLDESVGAVAGNVRVLNTREGIIPKMLDVSFMFSFDFLRAGQSVIDTVICTPGALSAYRRRVVLPVLSRWLHQRFFGKPANIGEDRAMTNLILKQGYSVHYQRSAPVYTRVPVRYATLCRMLLRWARSNIRETLILGSFVFKPFREGGTAGARFNFLLQVLVMLKSPVMLAVAVGCFFRWPLEIGLNMLLGVVLSSSVPAAFYLWRCRQSDALWAYPYGLFWLIGLSWIPIFAFATPHRTGWLTRQPAKGDRQPPRSLRQSMRGWSAASLKIAAPAPGSQWRPEPVAAAGEKASPHRRVSGSR